MLKDYDMLKILESKNFESLFNSANDMASIVIKNKIKEIPQDFFEPRIVIDKESNRQISLIQFSKEIVGMPNEKKEGLMLKYNIDPYDMKKLQSILESIKAAYEYGEPEEKKSKAKRNFEREGHAYGFSLMSEDKLSKAYPLWIAYLFANSLNPYSDIKTKLKEDGMDEKYTPEAIVGIIEHTNSLMQGKSNEEKKEFYVDSINGILDESMEKFMEEIER